VMIGHFTMEENSGRYGPDVPDRFILGIPLCSLHGNGVIVAVQGFGVDDVVVSVLGLAVVVVVVVVVVWIPFDASAMER